jgi:hypothetical protein
VTPPTANRTRDHEPTPREAKHPLRSPDSPSSSRAEGIVQAILTWLDGQL